MAGLGRALILLGGVLTAAGMLLLLGPKIPFLGKLPGDFHFKKGNLELSIPLATSILVSLVLSGVFWVIQHLGKKQ